MAKCLEFSQNLYLCSPIFENWIIFLNRMYAIVDIAGQQLKVEKDQKVFVHRLEAEEGSKVDFDKVLLIDNDGKVEVGAPIVKDMIVSATVVSHLKGDKVIVFKKKRRKGYKVKNGHRQYMTEILINDIAAGKASNKVAAKKEVAKEEKPAEAKAKPEAKKEAPKKAAAAKKAEPKKTAAAKEEKPAAAKKAAPKKTAAAKEEKPSAKKTTAAKKKEDKKED